MHLWSRPDAIYTSLCRLHRLTNECRLEGDKTNEIFHLLSQKVGGDISYVVPTKLKSGGTRPLRPPPIYAHVWKQVRSSGQGCLGAP